MPAAGLLLLLAAMFAPAASAQLRADDPAAGFTVSEDGVVQFRNSPRETSGEGSGREEFEPRNILQFETMTGLPRSLAGSTTTTRGVSPAGAPWDIEAVDGEVNEDGTLEITVRGLVLTDTGENPAAEFRAVVSCEGPGGTPSNATTRPFPADGAGNALIDDQVELPSPCLSPVVFITNVEGNWFAVTGHASGMEEGAAVEDVGAGLAAGIR